MLPAPVTYVSASSRVCGGGLKTRTGSSEREPRARSTMCGNMIRERHFRRTSCIGLERRAGVVADVRGWCGCTWTTWPAGSTSSPLNRGADGDDRERVARLLRERSRAAAAAARRACSDSHGHLQLVGGFLCVRLHGVVVDVVRGVVRRRRVREDRRRELHRVEARDRELVRRIAGEPGFVVPFRTSVVIVDRFSAFCFGAFDLIPSAASFVRSARVTSGCRKLSTAR